MSKPAWKHTATCRRDQPGGLAGELGPAPVHQARSLAVHKLVIPPTFLVLAYGAEPTVAGGLVAASSDRTNARARL
jgi:hypothetical protein